MAICNAHICAMVGVNAVGVGNIQIVQNADSVNTHIVTACGVECPKRCVRNRDIAHGDVVAFFNINHRRTRVKIARDIVFIFSFHETVPVCVNHALTRNRATVRFKTV